MTHHAFLNAILEQPHQDEPRLLYADWLDERCDPLGEFIRAQLRLALGSDAADIRRELETRERELLHEHERDWVGDIAPAVNWWSFQRGFIDEISITADQFLLHAARLLQTAPIQQAHLEQVGERLAALACCPHLARVRFLDLSGNPLGNMGVRLLAKSPHLTGVRGLNLSDTELGNAAAQALANSPHLKNLDELYLGHNHIGDDGAAALAGSPHLQSLTEIFVDDTEITWDGRKTLSTRFGRRVHF